MEQLDIAVEVEDFLLKVVGVGVELLPEGHRDSVLQLCAAHLDGIAVFVGLIAQGGDQSGEGSDKRLVHADDGQADGGGIDVVGRLAAVGMVVGIAILIFAFLVPHDFKGAVGDHLVGIHVDRSSSTALHHIHGEVFVELAIDDLAAGLRDGAGNLVVDGAKSVIGLHGSQFHVGNSDDIVGIVAHLLAGDMVVVEGALGLYAVVNISRHLELAQEV